MWQRHTHLVLPRPWNWGIAKRLGVVGDDQVVLLLEEVGVAGGVGEVDLLLVVRERALVRPAGRCAWSW